MHQELGSRIGVVVHRAVRRALEREAEKMGINMSEACRRALYAGLSQPDWSKYRRDSVVAIEEAGNA